MATPKKEWKQCKARSKRTGERCKRPCIEGKDVCYHHGGKSKGAAKENKHARKFGVYENLKEDLLPPDELELYNTVSIEPMDIFRQQLRFEMVKKARLLKERKKTLEDLELAGTQDENGRARPTTATLSMSQTQNQLRNRDGEVVTTSRTVTTNSEPFELRLMKIEQGIEQVDRHIRRIMKEMQEYEALHGVDTMPQSVNIKVVDCSGENDE